MHRSNARVRVRVPSSHVFAALLCASTAACGAGDGEPIPAPGAPDAPGGFAVGVTTFAWRDAARERDLTVELWYPARRPHTSDAVATYDVELFGAVLARVPAPLGAVRDAPPLRTGGPYPTVVFSHGFGAVRFQSVFLTEHLASHGYVVAAPDHTGNTMFDLVAGGIDDAAAARSSVDRPRDVSFVIDELLRLSGGGDPLLGGLVDAAAIGVAGHSFGGYTTLATSGAVIDVARLRAECMQDAGTERDCLALPLYPEATDTLSFGDARVRAAVPLAPGGMTTFRADGIARIAVPALVAGGTLDRTTPAAEEAIPIYDALTSMKYYLEIENAGHLGFSDVCTLVDQIGREAVESAAGDLVRDGCSPDNLAAPVVHGIVNTFVQAFFDRHLRGDATAASYLTEAHARTIPHASLRTGRP
jgi:predicted dienelactone hydrolase